MVGKVKKHTTTHDGEMVSPTHLLLPVGIRKMGSVTALYGESDHFLDFRLRSSIVSNGGEKYGGHSLLSMGSQK